MHNSRSFRVWLEGLAGSIAVGVGGALGWQCVSEISIGAGRGSGTVYA
jgi:hypothetical protein